MSSRSKFYFGRGHQNAADQNSSARFQWAVVEPPARANGESHSAKKKHARKRGRDIRRMPQRKVPGKGHRLGRITKNPFLNFLREFRRRHTGLSCVQIACEGGREWRGMNDDQKQLYYAKGIRSGSRKDKNPRSPKGGSLCKSSPRHSKSPRRSASKSM